MFARLGHLGDQRVLDLFAGSGALGIEALSRGAVSTHFVDQAGVAATQIRSNLAQLGVEERGTVLRSAVLPALGRLARRGEVFDLALVDPPYASGEAEAVLERLGSLGLIATDGRVVLETDRRHDPGAVAGFRRTDDRSYGDTLIIWYEPEAASSSPAAPPEGEPGGGVS